MNLIELKKRVENLKLNLLSEQDRLFCSTAVVTLWCNPWIWEEKKWMEDNA